MKNHRQFSLASLLIGTTGVGVAFAILPYPFVAFYVLLAFFFVTAILSRNGPVETRSFWWWFSFSGWLYVVLSISKISNISFLEAFESSSTWKSTLALLQQNWPSSNWKPEHYIIFAHTLVAIGAAISGAVLIPLLGQTIGLLRTRKS